MHNSKLKRKTLKSEPFRSVVSSLKSRDLAITSVGVLKVTLIQMDDDDLLDFIGD